MGDVENVRGKGERRQSEQTAIEAEMACLLMLYFLWPCLTFHPGLLT